MVLTHYYTSDKLIILVKLNVAHHEKICLFFSYEVMQQNMSARQTKHCY